MKAIIIEDETLAAESLVRQLQEVAPKIEVLAILHTIDESVEWIGSHPLPDLAFVDIHLSDGSSFSIFEECNFECPVIFTTAYDQYAIKAFDVNSIGYLLKPIDKEKLRCAIEKITRQNKDDGFHQMEKLLETLRVKENRSFRQNILITQQDKLIPLPVSRIACFYIDQRQVIALTTNGKEHRVEMTLDELQGQLNPHHFFRINRQYIVQHAAVKEIVLWFGGKYMLSLHVGSEKIIVPKARIGALKEWIETAGE